MFLKHDKFSCSAHPKDITKLAAVPAEHNTARGKENYTCVSAEARQYMYNLHVQCTCQVTCTGTCFQPLCTIQSNVRMCIICILNLRTILSMYIHVYTRLHTVQVCWCEYNLLWIMVLHGTEVL